MLHMISDDGGNDRKKFCSPAPEVLRESSLGVFSPSVSMSKCRLLQTAVTQRLL